MKKKLIGMALVAALSVFAQSALALPACTSANEGAQRTVDIFHFDDDGNYTGKTTTTVTCINAAPALEGPHAVYVWI